MTLKEIFNNVFVINLDDTPERYEDVVNEFKMYDIVNYERVKAEKPNNGINKADRLYGNRLSHLKCIKKARDRKLDYVIICEDDIQFNKNMIKEEVLNDIYNFLNNESWHIFYFGATNKTQPENTNYNNIKKVIKSWAIHCYAIHSSCYNIILSGEGQYNRGHPCDVMYHNLVQVRQRSFVSVPMLVWQRPGFSIAEGGFRDYYGVGRLKDECVK